MQSKTYQHVLAAMEVEQQNGSIIAAAKRLAKSHSARLTTITVVEPISHLVSGIDALGERGFEDRSERAARSALLQICRQNQIADNCAVVVRGSIGSAIARYASQHGVDLVVVGTHKRQGLELLFGTTSTAILHAAPSDVLGVRLFDAPAAYRRVVVAIDGQADSRAIIDRAASFASGAELRVITVLPSPFATESIGDDNGAAARLVSDLIIKVYGRRIRAAQSCIDAAGISANIEPLSGTPSKQISRYLRRHSANLIIVGSGAPIGAGRTIGSTTNNVLHRSPCDTLVVRESP